MIEYNQWGDPINQDEEEKKSTPTTNTTPKYTHRSSTQNYGTDYIVSTGLWIGLQVGIGLLNVIPIIGPIVGIVVLVIIGFFAPVNGNIKNWARANIIILVVALILVLLLGSTIGYSFL